MKEIKLKYGCNPNQLQAKAYIKDNKDLPFKVLNGNPSYINFLDAFNAWQLVKELKKMSNKASATSFKHLSPTSSAVANPISDKMKKSYFLQDYNDINDSAIATAYVRARGADRMSSFGDFIALSDECDECVARIISKEVSDGIIAPSYTKEAVDILKKKKNGAYVIIEMDINFIPNPIESKDVFGITLEQERNNFEINNLILNNIVTKNKNISKQAKEDLLLSLITLKYTQSNSICFAYDGQAIGVGAGGQSRIHCTKIAAHKAELWHLRQSDEVLNLEFLPDIKRPTKDNLIYQYLCNDESLFNNWKDFFKNKPKPYTYEMQKEFLSKINGISLGSDAFFPFADNIQIAIKSGVSYIVQSGGSKQDESVIAMCDLHNLVMIFTKIRLFHH